MSLEADYHRVCIFSLMRLIEFRNFVVTDLACKFPATLKTEKEGKKKERRGLISQLQMQHPVLKSRSGRYSNSMSPLSVVVSLSSNPSSPDFLAPSRASRKASLIRARSYIFTQVGRTITMDSTKSATHTGRQPAKVGKWRRSLLGVGARRLNCRELKYTRRSKVGPRL